MPELPVTDNVGRAFVIASQDVPDVEVHLDRPFAKAGDRKRPTESEGRAREAKEYTEAESLVLQMLDLGMIEWNRVGGYQISWGLCKKTIENMIATKAKLRVAVFDAVWSYYDRSNNTHRVFETVSSITSIIESIIGDD